MADKKKEKSTKKHPVEEMVIRDDKDKDVVIPIDTRKSDVSKALQLAAQYGWIDGGMHKDWVIDQMVRALAGPSYKQLVKALGDWDEGIAP